MDWLQWLSKTGLNSSVLHEYAQTFSQNELEEEDITYFSHEFLQSMGITIAKHRLEILKLARREKSHGLNNLKNPIAKLLHILKKTKKSLTNYIATLLQGENSGAIISVSRKNKLKRKNKVNGGAISYSSRWKKAMMMRNNSKKLVMINSGINNQERLMLTNSDYFDGDYDDDDDDDMMVVSTPKLDCYSSTLMHDLQQKSKEEKINGDEYHDDHEEHENYDYDHDNYDYDHDDQEDDLCWTPILEEIRWDAMFQDLNPN